MTEPNSWDEGASVTDDSEAEEPQPETEVRLTSPDTETFVIPDPDGFSIGRQWSKVSADQLERIQDAARLSGVTIEVKED